MSKRTLYPLTRRYLRLLLVWDLIAFVVFAMVFATTLPDWMETLGISQAAIKGIRIVAILVILLWGLTKIFDLRGIVLEAARQLDEEKSRSNGGEKP